MSPGCARLIQDKQEAGGEVHAQRRATIALFADGRPCGPGLARACAGGGAARRLRRRDRAGRRVRRRRLGTRGLRSRRRSRARAPGTRAPERRPGRPQPRAAQGGGVHARPASGACRRGLRQDARAHVPHRPHDRGRGRAPVAGAGHHVHQQGRGRDARAPGQGAARRHARHVDLHVPRHVRAHAARGRRPSGLQAKLHDLRRRRLEAPGQEHHERPRPRLEAVPAAGGALQDKPGEERPRVCGGDVLAGAVARGARGGPRVRGARPAAGPRERDGLRRPAGKDVRAPEQGAGGARPLPGALPPDQRGRVPGHERRAVRDHEPACEEVPQPHGRGRRRPVHL